MIKASELRVGNYLYGVIAPRIVETIGKDYFTDTYGNSTLFRDAKPIHLTEEILFKCDIHKNIQIEYDYILECYCVYLEDNFCLNNVKLYYLHQLQNLYFALTGEELTVNL